MTVVPPPSGDDTAMRPPCSFDQPLGGRHPEAGAARLRREEGREDPAALISGGMPGPRSIELRRAASRSIGAIVDVDHAAALHRLRGIDQQVLKHDGQQVGVAGDRRRRARRSSTSSARERRIALEQARRSETSSLAQVDSRQLGLRAAARTRSRSCIEIVQAVEPRDDLPDDRGVGAAGRQPPPITWMAPRTAASGFLTSCAITAAISPSSRERGLLAQPILELVRRARSWRMPVNCARRRSYISPTERCSGKVVPSLRRPVTCAADADDLRVSGLEVA